MSQNQSQSSVAIPDSGPLLKYEFTIAEVNLILEGLGFLAHNRVINLDTRIKQEGDAQIAAMIATNKASEEVSEKPIDTSNLAPVADPIR